MKYQTLLIPDFHRLFESALLAEKYKSAFEYNDFFHPQVYENEEEVERRIREYLALGRDTSKDTLHGVFLDMTVHSEDSHIAEYSKKRMYQSMEIARRLHVKGVVFHTGTIAGFQDESYTKGWLSVNESVFRQMCASYPDLNIYMENMFDLDWKLLTSLTERMKDVRNFGICLDYAHAQLSNYPGTQWMKACAPYIRHMHINDNDLKQDQHKTVGEGKIDWKEWKKALDDIGTTSGEYPSVLIEVSKLEQFEKSMQYVNDSLED